MTDIECNWECENKDINGYCIMKHIRFENTHYGEHCCRSRKKPTPNKNNTQEEK